MGAKEPGELVPGSDVTSVITYANLGNQPAQKVVVALNLGAGLAIAHSDPQPTGTGTNDAYPGGVAHWDIGDLGVGMSRTIRSVIHVTSVPDDGALVNATITADGIDIDASNNSASLLWHSPLPPGTIKSMRRASAIEKTAGGPEEARVQPVSHRLRHLWSIQSLALSCEFPMETLPSGKILATGEFAAMRFTGVPLTEPTLNTPEFAESAVTIPWTDPYIKLRLVAVAELVNEARVTSD